MGGSGLVCNVPAFNDPSQWVPGWRLVDWQGELIETSIGPAVGAGVYRFDAGSRRATRVLREDGLIYMDGYYLRLRNIALHLVNEIVTLRDSLDRAPSEDARLRIVLQGLTAEAQLSIVRDLYEQPGILCLGDAHEALRLAGFDTAFEMVSSGNVPVPVGYPFHEHLAQTRAVLV